jgi:NADPH:quinone reductase-like Zn-dependent oxidoreductase
MKAVVVNELGTPPAVRDDLTAPTPGADQVLVRVRASSANPVDNAIAAGMLKEMIGT